MLRALHITKCPTCDNERVNFFVCWFLTIYIRACRLWQVLLADFPQKLEIPSGMSKEDKEQRDRIVNRGYALEYLHNLSMEHTLVDDEDSRVDPLRPATAPN